MNNHSLEIFRNLSVELSTEQDQKGQIYKPMDQHETLHPNSDASPCPQHSLPDTINIAHSYSEPSSRAELACGDSRWNQGTGEGVQKNIPRYVHNQAPEQPYGIPCEPESSWPDFSTTTGMQPFSPGYRHFQASDRPEVSLPLSPPENISSLSFPYQSTFPDYVHDPWTENQEHRPEHVEPG